MAQEREGVGSYAEFTEKILPRIREEGYDTVQLMGIAEHPYYGSFGYHVSNFFAPSSRFGTPEALKTLVRTAHELGLAVVMDLVHAHYVKNLNEGINELDGTDHLYSLPGTAGEQPYWDSKTFDYGKEQVRHFLLSNVKYWLDEFHFDGYRFDRGDLDDLSSSRTHRFQPKGTIFRRRGKRACPHLPYAGQYAGTRLPSPGRYDRRGGERHAGHRGSDRRRRRRLRLPPGHGHSGFLDPTAQGGTRRKVGHTRHLARSDRPSARHQDGRLCRIARPGAGGRPDPRVPADGKGDVRTHGPRLAKSGHRSRHGTAQDDPARHDLGGRGRLPQLHGQRIRTSRMDRLSARGQRLELRLRPATMVARGQRTACATPSSGSSTGR